MNHKETESLKILVRSTNWIGDAIMTTPALCALRELLPSAHISVLAKKWVAQVFSNHPCVDEILLLDDVEGSSFRKRLSISDRMKKKGFDIAFIFPNSFDSALVPWLSRIPIRVGYRTDARSLLLTCPVPVPKDKSKRHEVYYYLGLVSYFAKIFPEFVSGASAEAVFKSSPRLRIEIGSKESAWAKETFSTLSGNQRVRWIGLNPGAAYGPAKCWPRERFAALAKELVNRVDDVHVIVFGTDKEFDTAQVICTPLGNRGHNLAGKTSLGEVMALISQLDLLVTNDSGLMHVGAALDIPLVAIFGSTNPLTTGPWSDKSVVVRKELPCSPCLARQCKSDFRCMKEIEVEEVLEECLLIMEKV